MGEPNGDRANVPAQVGFSVRTQDGPVRNSGFRDSPCGGYFLFIVWIGPRMIGWFKAVFSISVLNLTGDI